MLIVAGTITAEPGGRDAFLAAVQPMVSATLTESGCREYTFSADPNDETRIMLYELWDDQTSLDAHFASEHMAAWQETRKGLPVVSAEIKKYNIASVEALG
jgi:quinol monooxygenase YgiN